MVTIVDNTVLYSWNLPRIDLKHFHTQNITTGCPHLLVILNFVPWNNPFKQVSHHLCFQTPPSHCLGSAEVGELKDHTDRHKQHSM